MQDFLLDFLQSKRKVWPKQNL